VECDIIYKGLTIKGQKLDLLVENEVVVELKSLSKMPEVALAQTLSYLKATNLKRGLIINFGEKRLIDGIKRVSL
jgi:GxxExxY protein